MKLSKPKSHLKNKCTIIQIKDNGYPKETNFENFFSKSYSNKKERGIFLHNGSIYPTFTILNKKQFLKNIEKGKYQIESFDEPLQLEKFRQSARIESFKKSSFDNYNFDFLFNNNYNLNKIALIENLSKKKSDNSNKSIKDNKFIIDKELQEINSSNINSQIMQTFSSVNNSINMENVEIEIDKPLIQRMKYRHNKKQSPLSKSYIQKKNMNKLYRYNNFNNNSISNSQSNNSLNKLFNSTLSNSSNPQNNNSINLSLLSSISNPNKKMEILTNHYFLVTEEEIDEGRKDYYYKHNNNYQYTNKYIKSFKNWKISNESKLLTNEVLNHFEKMKICEKIRNHEDSEINILITEDNKNLSDYENEDQGKLTLDDLTDDTNEKNLNTLINDINLSKNEFDDKVRIDEYDFSNSKFTFDSNSMLNTPFNNSNISNIENNKLKKQTPLLRNSKPYFPSSIKLHKKINSNNNESNNIIKNELTNEKIINDKEINYYMFNKNMKMNTSPNYTYSISESLELDNNKLSNNSNTNVKINTNNSNITNPNPLILIETNDNEPGNLYNQVISEENENEENISIKKKNSRKNTINSRFSEEYNDWADAPLDDYDEEENEIDEKKENEIPLPKFIEELNRDIIKGDLRELLNIISINNYNDIKKKIKNIIKENAHSQEKLIDILFIKAIYEPYFQPLYANLCVQLDKFLMNKKDKIKSPLRLKIIDNCKKNFVSIKKSTNNKNYVLGNVSFIAELINSQLISKKAGIQCISNLIEKFKKFSDEDNSIVDRIQVKYLYLESVIIFLDKFGTGFMNNNYKEFDQDYENEIVKDMNILKSIYNDEKNNDMPSYLRYKLINLIEKEKNNWKPYFYETVNQINIEKIEKKNKNNNYNNKNNNYNYNRNNNNKNNRNNNYNNNKW